ncbi:MAG: SH3 domain-containing protein [Coleofasciculaceae cyanobacterium]
MSLSGIAKFFIGFILGIAILVGSSAAAVFYFWTQLSVVPSRPTFSEEKPQPSPVAQKAAKTNSTAAINKPATPVKASPKELPAGAYKARVTWPEGLILRDAAGADAARIGGVAFNQEVVVLQESSDQRWQKVSVGDGDLEGWIKAGNADRVN